MRTKWTPEKLAAVADLYPLIGIRLAYKRRVWRGKGRKRKLVRKYVPAHGILYDQYCLLPKPDTIYGLYVNLHERGHFYLRHFNYHDAPTKKLADMYTGNGELSEGEQEYQAEQWAITTMQRHGVPVSKRIREDAKKYVRDCIRDDAKKGKGHPHHVKRWAKRKPRR